MWSKKDAVRFRDGNHVRFRDDSGHRPMKGRGDIQDSREIIQKLKDLKWASEPNAFSVPADKTTNPHFLNEFKKSLDSHSASRYRAT
jgi:hypothetical protein